jgi:1,4-dihydroxy-2-naphthoate octaprenyltransferase
MDVTRAQPEPNPTPDTLPRDLPRDGYAGRTPPLPPAQTLLGAFTRTCRFDAALAAVTPLLAVSTVAWWQTGTLNVPVLLFALAAGYGAALGVQLLTEYHDRLRAAAPHVKGALRAAGQFTAASRAPDLHLGEIKSLGYIAFLISFLCHLWLGLLGGWPMLLFGGVALLLAWSYAAGPVRYARWGFGLGESGLFLALGLIPAIAGYYAQTAILDHLALWAAVPFAMLGSLILIAHSLTLDRRDWLIRKRTLAVQMGRPRTIDFSAVLLIGAFVSIVFAAIVTELPLRTMLALLGLPVATSAFSQLDREDLPPAQSARLYTAAIHATLATSLLYTLALITDRLW